MNPGARVKYHRDFWPAACRAQKWDHRDQAKRRAVCLDCMRQVRGPRVTTSDPAFGPDETTALFTYLAFLADPASLDKSAAWLDFQIDYHACNRARQADWHERETYGVRGSPKLQRDRFAKRTTAAGEPLESFDPKEIYKRHVTMASRHQKKVRAEKKAQPPVYVPTTAVPPAGVVILLPPPADLEHACNAPDPAYHPPVGQPF